MESVQVWSKDYFLNNREVCLQKLKNLSPEERSALKTNLEQNASNKLVLFTGMVFDTQEPEFYCETYEVKSLQDGNILRVESGKYSDRLNLKEGETVEDPSRHLSERQTLFVSQAPSTNLWVTEVDAAEVSNKRKLENIVSDVTTARAFTVKVYENHAYPINSLVEIIGFLTLKASTIDSMDTDMFSDEVQSSSPPFTIHAVVIEELSHNNPLLLASTAEPYSHEAVRRDLLKLLTQFMFGDEVAASYVLFHLISTCYARVNGEVLGKFSLNLTCSSVPQDLLTDYVKKFYNFIELIVPNSLYFPLTIENLNKSTFVPKKDYKTNRLQTGMLQLFKHTQLVLDETKLEGGKLEEAGCLAVADLSELVRSQQINYDFSFYKIPFETNIPVLIVSEGKSLLPSDFIVPIQPVEGAAQLINENIAAGVHFLRPKLNVVRRYLTECRLSSFEIGESETKMIESDFVKMREETSLQVEHLHALLVVSRLIGISKGNKTLDVSSWEAAKKLEVERMSRISKRVKNES